MESQQHVLEEILTDHGLQVSTYKDWVFETGKPFPGVRANTVVISSGVNGFVVQMNVEVLVENQVLIHECLVGMGGTEEKATQDAIGNFCINSLHVLLAALWGRVDEEQVVVEEWKIGNSDWDVIIGNYGVRTLDRSAVDVPEELFPTIAGLIQRVSLTKDLYWVRSFYCNLNENEATVEVLLNNQEWADAQQAISNVAWLRSNSYYSVRNFLILRRKKR